MNLGWERFIDKIQKALVITEKVDNTDFMKDTIKKVKFKPQTGSKLYSTYILDKGLISRI